MTTELKKILRTATAIIEIKIISKLNLLIHIVRKLPLIGKHLGSCYLFPYLKKAVSFVWLPIYFIYRLILAFLSLLLALGVAFGVSGLILAIRGEAMAWSFQTLPLSINSGLLFFSIYIIPSLLKNYVYNHQSDIYQFNTLFQMNPQQIAVVYSLIDPVFIALGRTLAFAMILPVISDLTVIGSLCWGSFIYLFHCLIQALNMLYYAKRSVTASKRWYFWLMQILLLPGSALCLILSGLNISRLGHIALLLMVGPAIFAIRYLARYQHYSRLISYSSNVFSNKQEKIAEITDTSKVKLDNVEKLYSEDILAGTGKEGYDLLNALFFKRHRKYLLKPMLTKSAILLMLAASGIIAAFFISGGKEAMTNIMKRSTLFLPLLYYYMSNGTELTRSMFVNCDNSLLRYNFYKKGDALLRMFRLRLFSEFKLMALPTSALLVFFTIVAFAFMRDDFSTVIAAAGLSLLLATFFSVFPLFLYYILQPFSDDGNIKNPVIQFINVLIYFAVYGLANINVQPAILLPVLSGTLIVFIFVASVLIYKLAPKTFRLKGNR